VNPAERLQVLYVEGEAMNKPLENVTIVGAGTLGAQIAILAVNAGCRVVVFDLVPEAFEAMVAKLRSDLQAKGVTPFIAYERWAALQEKVSIVTDLDRALKDAELVIEAIPENMELKRNMFQQLGRKAPGSAILATNSSSIPVSHLEDSSGRPERCLNIHFYMPLQGMNIADVMGGTRTRPEVLQTGIAWVRSLGIIPLTVNKELLGFCFNRVWRAVKREVLRMWADGYVDFRDIDRAWMVFTGNRSGPGPFGLMDNVGLDVVWDIEMVYYHESNDPRDHPPEALKKKIEKGELGVKTGKGFYTYPNPEYRQPDFLNPRAPISGSND
jgi:3-hydroxybutyryl-CoA dehydrogenase